MPPLAGSNLQASTNGSVPTGHFLAATRLVVRFSVNNCSTRVGVQSARVTDRTPSPRSFSPSACLQMICSGVCFRFFTAVLSLLPQNNWGSGLAQRVDQFRGQGSTAVQLGRLD